MCGIVGVVGEPVDPELYGRMAMRLQHRGPDSHGDWHEEAVWLAHRRLAILDLSPAGHQPMHSQCGQFVLVFNGEIYNYRDLRAELEKSGSSFRGTSDTEVILAAVVCWGVELAVKKLEGMFACALYDRAEKNLWLFRDPMGIKPLYICHQGHRLAFASELTPLLSLPWITRRTDPDALFSYFRYGCVPAPRSIIAGITKLESGGLLRFHDGAVTSKRYWDLAAIAQTRHANSAVLGLREAADQLEQALRASVRQQMQSDVPYGAFLSGGIDSSTVVAMMQAESSHPVKTFSLGFTETSHDESVHARAVAAHLGTEHHELILHADEIPELALAAGACYDEPFADNSSVPTYLISRFARQHVKVCLSGDGGDELFGGYPRYYWARRIERVRQYLTPWGVKAVTALAQGVPDYFWNGMVDPLTRRRFSSSEGLAHRVRRFAHYLDCPRADIYPSLVAYCSDPSILLGHSSVVPSGPDASAFPALPWAEEMMLTDQLNFLQDDVLVKLDRASMAVSLEARVPLLSHSVVELSWSFASALKLPDSGDRGKILLREVLSRYMPLQLVDRPKQGFGMPVGRWLRGPLRDWAESLLTPSALDACGLRADIVQSLWRHHLSGQNHQAILWMVLMYRQWHDRTFNNGCVE